MVTNIWNKYLPVIKILLKRTKSGEQTLAINQSDFEKAGLARKAGVKFTLVFTKGKVENVVIASVAAADLAAGLLSDESVKALFAENDYRISMNTKYQLHIEQLQREDKEEETLAMSHAGM